MPTSTIFLKSRRVNPNWRFRLFGTSWRL